MQTMLEVRKKLKAKKPHFLRQDFNKQNCLAQVWRKPRGLHSKVRKSKRGKPARVQQGYGSPREVKGMDPFGFRPILVSTPAQLETIDAKKESVIVSSTVGKKKRVEILKLAMQKNIKLLNVKNASEYVASVEKQFSEKKKTKETEKKKDTKAKEKESKPLADKITEEEAKEAEKKEKEKVLTQRER